ncbi:hypothetical protein SCLCIDRAFT_1222000 [Scleroderma citrinum Foug A]|uniref:Uncharacterized protein n=1 Tax=Scleroderma citrinum Foug A TaxID=1036808 RepID=A0A0C3DE81_9AGAM|nr:hypothetical protein SCLCIDRAFT_1222000 [Scleroderma citrinum Foug A]
MGCNSEPDRVNVHQRVRNNIKLYPADWVCMFSPSSDQEDDVERLCGSAYTLNGVVQPGQMPHILRCRNIEQPQRLLTHMGLRNWMDA